MLNYKAIWRIYNSRYISIIGEPVKSVQTPDPKDLQRKKVWFVAIEVKAHRNEISRLRNEGCSLRLIWRELRDSGRICASYSGFRYAWGKLQKTEETYEQTSEIKELNHSPSTLTLVERQERETNDAVQMVLEKRRAKSMNR